MIAAGIGNWVTINGEHVFIREGQSLKDALVQRNATRQDVGQPLAFEPSDRVKRAMAAYKPCEAAKQRIADESEKRLSDAVGIPRTKDNSAFDLRNSKVGVEVKTFVDTKNGKITMSKDALARKVKEAEKEGLRTYTVVADRRSGKTQYYFADRLGSLRVGSMEPVTLIQLKERLR